MNGYRYVMLDPTGNLTCLVLDPVPDSEKPAVTASLLHDCEQVGYLVPPRAACVAARLEMMGGEFCGNATMATACWLAGETGIRPGETRQLLLEVSGAKEPLPCTVRLLPEGFEGTVEIPGTPSFFTFDSDNASLTGVRMDGIAHLIFPESLARDKAEDLLRRLADELPDDAVGLLQWDGHFMRPLVYVRATDTLVWETGCGSGSIAIGFLRARESGETTTETEVRQPGGAILVRVRHDGPVTLTGKVRILTEGRTGVEY